MEILHITDQETWLSARKAGSYEADTLHSDGFIHCCLPDQLDGVLKKWFSGVDDLLVLEIETDLLEARLVYENLEGGSEKFPHIYGPIPITAVVNTRPI
jgi:uncharacterized protein (DUF952 family)